MPPLWRRRHGPDGNGRSRTSYGASFREHCRSLADRTGADFVSSVTECPSMDAALSKLTARLLRQRAIKGKVLTEKIAANKVEVIS